MNEPNSFVRQSFDDDPMPADARERLWTTMETRLSRQAQLRNLLRAGLLLLLAAIVVTGVLIRNAGRSATIGGGVGNAFPIAADSIPTDLPAENSMSQETHKTYETQPAVPQALIPLLGHRSALRMDLVNFESRREQLITRLNQTAGSEHDRVAAQIVDVERQIAATERAIGIIDRQLAGDESHFSFDFGSKNVPVIAPGAPVMEIPQVISIGSGLPNEAAWILGGAGTLLTLGMIVMLVYMRKVARATRNALTTIEGQVSSQHATLAAGIDAIALEVERLGEGQRFMSKALADKATAR